MLTTFDGLEKTFFSNLLRTGPADTRGLAILLFPAAHHSLELVGRADALP